MSDNVRAKPSKPKTDLPTDQPCPPGGMTLDEYRTRAKDMVDYIANYLDTIRDRRVFPDVSPGYMAKLVPDACPVRPEAWEDIMADVERVIMPGVTHWLSPHNHSYFPALSSFPSLLGDMLADAVNNLGFTWASSPACTELETIVMDWLGKMIGLPPVFLHGNKMRKSLGGGCIQTTASDCTFVTLLAARKDAIRRIKVTSPDMDDAEINGRLIGYCSDQAHSSVEKAGLIGLVKLRFLPSDENLSLRGDTLQEAVSRDKEMGLIPFYLCATLGTTGACAFDNLKEIGPICQAENMWLHIDAAYAGSAFICPEYRHLMAGIEFSNSFAFNPSKWLMVHFDCSAMWVRDATDLHRTFNVEPLYLQHENSGAAIDYMHWQIALSRRFRSLKLWFVLRSFGVEGLQAHIRRGVEKAIYFERLVRADRRFEIPARRHLGLVVFRLMGPNQLTETLLKRLNKQGEIHMVPASLQGKYVIRFTVTSQYTTQEDIDRDWKIITDMSSKILSEARTTTEDSILEKEEEELEEEIENDFGEENTAYDDDDNDDDGDEDGGVENDTEEEDLEVSFTKKGDEFDFKMKKGVSSDSSSTHFNGYISHGKENGTLERRNNDDNNEAGVDDNDDGDNDERNRKIKKMNGSARKHANDLEPLKTTAVKPRQKSNSLSEENACGKFENEVGSPPKLNSSNQQTAGGQVGSTDRKKPPCGNLKILNSKSAAAKRRDYGFSLLLSNVPMSPKIVNGSFAALFDGEDGEGSCNSLDLSSLTRNWGGGMGGEFIRLSPRKRGKLSGAEKQLSLDYGVLSASHKTCPSRMAMMGSLDSKIDDILELSTALKGAKNKKGKQEGDGEGNKDTETASEDCVGDNDVDEKGVGVQGDGGENGKNGLGKGIGAVVKENGSSLKMEGGMENAQVVGGGGKGGNKDGGKGERMKSDMKGNGRVVMEKENWDTGHARDVTSVNEINDASGPGQKQKSVCPLCGRCDV